MPDKIITLYAFFDDLLKAIHHKDDPQAQLTTAEVMTIAAVACEFFTGNYQKALDFLVSHRYIKPFSKSRFSGKPSEIDVAEQQGKKPPSYSVVYDVVRKLPAALLTLAHEGTKAYADSFELVHRREAERPNAVWQADHTQLDVIAVKGDGTTAKPWLTVII